MGFEGFGDGALILNVVVIFIAIATVGKMRRQEKIKIELAKHAKKPTQKSSKSMKFKSNEALSKKTAIDESEEHEDESDSMRNAMAQRRRQSNLEALSIYRKLDGSPLDADRDADLWFEVRRKSVSATDARRLIKLNGQDSLQRVQLMQEKVLGLVSFYTSAFDQGIARESHIANWVQEHFSGFNFQHNRNLFVGKNNRHVATPDMISGDGLCEIKVSTKNAKSLSGVYRDQLQWQMHVTGLGRLLLVVEHRETYAKDWIWVERNQRRINELVVAADTFIQELDEELSKYVEPDSETVIQRRATIPTQNSVDREEELSTPALSNRALEDLRFNVDDESELTDEDYEKIIRLYIGNTDVSGIAYEINATQAVVVTALSRMIFGLGGKLVNENAPNFGKGWTSIDTSKFNDLYAQGQPIPKIADNLGRDQLGVCFRVFNHDHPSIPLQFVRFWDESK